MIGIDVIEVERVKTTQSFLKKIAFDEEIDYIMQNPKREIVAQKTAALWATKEAVMKALGLGKDSKVVFKDIMLLHTETGAPYVKLFGKACVEFERCFLGKNIEVSLSHSKTCAVAVAIIV